MKENQYPGRYMLQGLSFDLFSEDGFQALHQATMDVLENNGIMVTDKEAQEIFKKGGCHVDVKTNMVRIPEKIVKKALSTVPSKFYLYGRDGKAIAMECGGKVHYTCFGTGIQMCNYLGNGKFETMDSTKNDLINCGKIVDWAENMDFFSLPVSARDVAGKGMVDVHEMFISIRSTSKHFHHVDPVGIHVDYYWELVKAFYGGDEQMAFDMPLCSLLICPTSPLGLCDNACQVIIKGARFGMPVNVLSMAMSGGTSPVFIAGTLVTHNAEILSGIVLSQLTVPGAKNWCGSSTTCFDLLHGTAPVGAPELALISSSVAKLGQRYGLPTFVAGI